MKGDYVFKTFGEVEKKAQSLPEGETMVGVFEVKNKPGLYLYIGDNFAQHGWAVTDTELRELYGILKRRYE